MAPLKRASRGVSADSPRSTFSVGAEPHVGRGSRSSAELQPARWRPIVLGGRRPLRGSGHVAVLTDDSGEAVTMLNDHRLNERGQGRLGPR